MIDMASGSRRAGMAALWQFGCRYRGGGGPAQGLDHEELRLVDPLCFLPLVLLVVQSPLCESATIVRHLPQPIWVLNLTVVGLAQGLRISLGRLGAVGRSVPLLL